MFDPPCLEPSNKERKAAINTKGQTKREQTNLMKLLNSLRRSQNAVWCAGSHFSSFAVLASLEERIKLFDEKVLCTWKATSGSKSEGERWVVQCPFYVIYDVLLINAHRENLATRNDN